MTRQATSGGIAASTSRHPVSADASIISAGRRKRNRDNSYGMVVPKTIGEVDATAATIADVHLRIAKSQEHRRFPDLKRATRALLADVLAVVLCPGIPVNQRTTAHAWLVLGCWCRVLRWASASGRGSGGGHTRVVRSASRAAIRPKEGAFRRPTFFFFYLRAGGPVALVFLRVADPPACARTRARFHRREGSGRES